MTWLTKRRVQFSTRCLAPQIEIADFEGQDVVHYSIPAIQDTGGPITEPASDIASNKLLLSGGEVLVSRLNVHKNCTAIVAQHDEPILASTEFVALTPISIEPRYLQYCFQSQDTVQELTSLAQSATRSHARIDPAEILKLKIPQPDGQVQLVVSDFLDRETARIDSLIAEKQRMLALLEEKHTALISRVVTRGLNPNVPIKVSGHEWLGQIPAHWHVDRAKNLFMVRDERSEAGAEELLTVSHITGVTRRADKEVTMFEADDKAGYKRCLPGDLAINTLWAWMGAMGISPMEGIVSPDYHVYQSKGQLLPEYIGLLCRSRAFVAEVSRWSKGVWSSRLRLYPENFFEMRLPVPPHEEQRAIVQAVEADQRKANALSETLQQSIALAKERRSALISAAVTGQIPLEEMAA
jgi:type I restriction enzyme S subunit